MNAIDEADVSIIVFDGSQISLTEQDVRIAGYVHEAGKASVIVVNKWDIKTKSKEEYLKMLNQDLSFMSYFQVIFVSALTGASTGQIMQLVEKVMKTPARESRQVFLMTYCTMQFLILSHQLKVADEQK